MSDEDRLKFQELSVEDQANFIDNDAAAMQDVFDQLNNTMNPVGKNETVWVGDAANKEEMSYNALASKFHEFINAVTNFSNALRQDAEIASSTETSIMTDE